MALWTQQDIDNLKANMASGTLSIKYGGPPARERTFQSLAEMRKLLAEMVADVAASAPGAANTSRRYTKHSQGFGRRGRGSFRRNE